MFSFDKSWGQNNGNETTAENKILWGKLAQEKSELLYPNT
jgi:hypothetical protein